MKMDEEEKKILNKNRRCATSLFPPHTTEAAKRKF
jgi:hypothetical protein